MIKSTLENGKQVGNVTFLDSTSIEDTYRTGARSFFFLASTIVSYLSLRFAPIKLLTLGISTSSVDIV